MMDFDEAQRVLGGAQLRSNHPVNFLPKNPGLWPYGYRTAFGCRVSFTNVIDDHDLIDLTHCGAGASPLGYGNGLVNRAVDDALRSGTHGTVTSHYELEYARRALAHTHFDQIRFALTGAEGMAMAVDLARASTGNYEVATLSNYHGWILGKPGKFRIESGITPAYSVSDLKGLQKTRSLAAVIVEPARWTLYGSEGSHARETFQKLLRSVRDWCRENRVLLIFDEVATGFREKTFALPNGAAIPDIAVYGKGISNGIPFSAVIGTNKAFAPLLNESFCSSTYWAGSLGPAAALAVLDHARLSDGESFAAMAASAHTYASTLINAAEAEKVDIEVRRLALPMIAWSFKGGSDPMPIWTTAMMEHGFLAGNRFYAMAAHDRDKGFNDNVLFEAFSDAFNRAKKGIA